MACKQRLLGLAGAIAMCSAACAAEPEASDGETGADTQSNTDTDTDTDTGGPAINCLQAVTAEECDAAVPMDIGNVGCAWFDAFAVTGDGESCSFEPAGGICGEVGVGGTECYQSVTSCGMVISNTDDMGNMILVHVSLAAACAFDAGQGFDLCYGPQDTETSSSSGMDTNICECACADNWPG